MRRLTTMGHITMTQAFLPKKAQRVFYPAAAEGSY